jgi:hypothetical protein
MAGEEISIDELLDKQSSSSAIRATVERIEGDDSRVTITPYIQGIGCLCNRSLSVPKAAVASIRTTDDVHTCCGKQLSVVEISFGDETLEDVFKQLGSNSLLAPPQNPRVAEALGPYPAYPPRPSYASPYGLQYSAAPAWHPYFSVGRPRRTAFQSDAILPFPAPGSSAVACNLAKEKCLTWCADAVDQELCVCLCVQQWHFCMGTPPPLCKGLDF